MCALQSSDRPLTIALCDLVARRQIRVEVVLPVERRTRLYICVERDCCPDGKLDAFWVQSLRVVLELHDKTRKRRTGSVPGNAASCKATYELGFSPGLLVSASGMNVSEAQTSLCTCQKRVFCAT